MISSCIDEFVGVTEILSGNDNYTFSDVSSQAVKVLNDNNIRACPPLPVSHKLICLGAEVVTFNVTITCKILYTCTAYLGFLAQLISLWVVWPGINLPSLMTHLKG